VQHRRARVFRAISDWKVRRGDKRARDEKGREGYLVGEGLLGEGDDLGAGPRGEGHEYGEGHHQEVDL
jgi:hypothetical protein